MTEAADVALRTVRYPDGELAGFTPFEVGCPEDWTVDRAPQALAVFGEPDPDPRFRANVFIGADRVDGGLTLDQVVATVLGPSDEPGVLELEPAGDEEVLAVAERPAYGRTRTLEVDEAPGLELFQLQVLFFAPDDAGAPTRDLFTVHGTCLAERAEAYVPLFVAVLESFRFLAP